MRKLGGPVLISIALFTAACSGGGDTADPTTTTSIATTSSSTVQTTTSAAPTTTTELVTTTTRYEPEEVATGARPTSFIARIKFGEGPTNWYHVDLDTGKIQRPVDDDEGYILDPLVSPDGRFRFELAGLDQHPRIQPEEVAEFFEENGSNGEWTPQMGPEAAAALWLLPVIVNRDTGAIVHWFNDVRWYNSGHVSVNYVFEPQGYVGADYLAFNTYNTKYEMRQGHLTNSIDSPNLYDGVGMQWNEDLYIHPVRQANGNVVAVAGRKGYQNAVAEPPFIGVVFKPDRYGVIATFAIGDGQTPINDLDYDESGTWLLATFDNSIEWQGGGQKESIAITDPDGREFYVSSALW